MKVLHNSCKTVTRGLPDMSTLSPWVYISGRPAVPITHYIKTNVVLH